MSGHGHLDVKEAARSVGGIHAEFHGVLRMERRQQSANNKSGKSHSSQFYRARSNGCSRAPAPDYKEILCNVPHKPNGAAT
jgi:hypothetical protein